MTPISSLLTLVETYCAARGIAEATLSKRVFSDGKRIAGIRAGSDIGVRRHAEAVQWFSDHWPDGLTWPEDVDRPEGTMEAAE